MRTGLKIAGWLLVGAVAVRIAMRLNEVTQRLLDEHRDMVKIKQAQEDAEELVDFHRRFSPRKNTTAAQSGYGLFDYLDVIEPEGFDHFGKEGDTK